MPELMPAMQSARYILRKKQDNFPKILVRALRKTHPPIWFSTIFTQIEKKVNLPDAIIDDSYSIVMLTHATSFGKTICMIEVELGVIILLSEMTAIDTRQRYDWIKQTAPFACEFNRAIADAALLPIGG